MFEEESVVRIHCPCGAKLVIRGNNMVHAFHADYMTAENFQKRHAECVKAAAEKLRDPSRRGGED